MSILRLSIRLPLFFAYLILGLLIALCFLITCGWNWFNTQAGQKVIMIWLQGLAFILGIRIHASGKCIRKPALLVANHISWLDIVVLGSQCPTAFLSKVEVRSWPLIGFLCAISGTLFVNRDSKKSIGETREKIQASIKAGRSVVIFPEGTTTDGESIKPFKSSLYQSSVELGTVVQAIAIQYPSINGRKSHAPYINDDTFFGHLLGVLKEPHTDVNLVFCTPLNYQEGFSRKKLAEITYAQVCSVQSNLRTLNTA